jgi:hypothetical protein
MFYNNKSTAIHIGGLFARWWFCSSCSGSSSYPTVASMSRVVAKLSSLVQQLAVFAAVPLNCGSTPPLCNDFACCLHKIRLFALFCADPFSAPPSSLNGGDTPPKSVFSPPTAGSMSAKYTRLATPYNFFYLLLITRHSLLFTFLFPKEALCHRIV